MPSPRLIPFFVLLGVSSFGAESFVVPTSYTFSVQPSASYADPTGHKLTDFVATVNSWGSGSFNTADFVGWADQDSVTIRFNFGAPISIQAANFYFAASYSPSSVFYPSGLGLHTSSDSFGPDSYTTIRNPSAVGTTVPYTFYPDGLLTDHLILEIKPTGGWLMMSEATFTTSAIPEPSTYAAMAGALMLGFAMWNRRRKALR